MRRKRGRLIAVVAALLLLLVFLFGAESMAKPKKIIINEKDALIIKGKIIRPEMSLILQRSKINYDALKLKESFLPQIVRSVEQEIF